jgi:hypothetical protein
VTRSDADSLATELAAVVESLARLEERLGALDRLTAVRIDSQADKVALALASADRAISKAEMATERRFEAVNEFRATLTDQAAQFVTRREFEALRSAGTERMDEFKEWLDRTQGGKTKVGDQRAVLATIIGVATLVITVVVVVVNILTQ